MKKSPHKIEFTGESGALKKGSDGAHAQPDGIARQTSAPRY